MIFPAEFLEVGIDTIVAAVTSRTRTLEALFLRTVAMSEAECDEKFLVSRAVTEAGHAHIRMFPANVLQRWLIAKKPGRDTSSPA
jgi:hypothetical protein